MSPETHLLASWLIAAKTTNNPRDCRLVTLAGILPDADGLGLLLDAASQGIWHKRTLFYEHYHHYLLHGWFGALVITAVLTCFARAGAWRCWRRSSSICICSAILWAPAVRLRRNWPTFYCGPFHKDPMWLWKGQWRLDGWQNKLRLDHTFVSVLRKWRAAFERRLRST